MKVLENGCPQHEHPEKSNPDIHWTIEVCNGDLRDWFESLDVVYSRTSENEHPWSMWTHAEVHGQTHTARLTKPVPIVRDSFEQVVRDLVSQNACSISPDIVKILNRARKLLDKGE